MENIRMTGIINKHVIRLSKLKKKKKQGNVRIILFLTKRKHGIILNNS